MKATYGEVKLDSRLTQDQNSNVTYVESREIFKDPITDDGTKKSKKGLLCVTRDESGKLICLDQCHWDTEKSGLLQTVFKDGKLIKETTLEEIRNRLNTI